MQTEPARGGATAFASSAPLLRLQLIGSMRVEDARGQNIPIRGRKTRAILAFLAMQAGQPVSRNRLAGMVWDRVPDAQAKQSLRSALSELTTVLGDTASELIERDSDNLRLQFDQCWIDAHTLTQAEPGPIF